VTNLISPMPCFFIIPFRNKLGTLFVVVQVFYLFVTDSVSSLSLVDFVETISGFFIAFPFELDFELDELDFELDELDFELDFELDELDFELDFELDSELDSELDFELDLRSLSDMGNKVSFGADFAFEDFFSLLRFEELLFLVIVARLNRLFSLSNICIRFSSLVEEELMSFLVACMSLSAT
jgi:hypothetical protein